MPKGGKRIERRGCDSGNDPVSILLSLPSTSRIMACMGDIDKILPCGEPDVEGVSIHARNGHGHAPLAEQAKNRWPWPYKKKRHGRTGAWSKSGCKRMVRHHRQSMPDLRWSLHRGQSLTNLLTFLEMVWWRLGFGQLKRLP